MILNLLKKLGLSNLMNHRYKNILNSTMIYPERRYLESIQITKTLLSLKKSGEKKNKIYQLKESLSKNQFL